MMGRLKEVRGLEKALPIDILGPRLPTHTWRGRHMHEDSRWRRQPGKNIRNSITNYRFLGFFVSLTASNLLPLDFLKIDHYCGGFECKMRRVGQILTKLSIAENFKEWTFGQFAWIIGLVTLRITTDRTYLRKDVYYGYF